MAQPLDNIQPSRINKAALWDWTGSFQRNGVEIATVDDINAILPPQAGHAGEVLGTDGTNASWGAGGGGVAIGSPVTGSTSGSILFADSGNLQQDNSNLFW